MLAVRVYSLRKESSLSDGLSLKRNIAWNTIGSVTRLACNYLITIAVVRLSDGYDAAGVLALAMSVSNMIVPLADYRLRTIHVTDVHNEHTASQYMGMRLFCTGVSFLIGVIYGVVTCSSGYIPAIVLYLASSLIANIIEGLHAIDQRNHRMDFIGRSYILQGISNLAGFSACLFLTNSIELSIGLMALANCAILFFYDVPHASRFEIIRPTFDLRDMFITLSALTPLVLAQVFSSAVLTIPRQYLAETWGESQLGIYSSVASPTVIIQMGASYIYGPLMTEFAERFATDMHSALVLFRKTIMSLIGISAVLSIGLLLAGKWILVLLFGQDIAEYAYLLLPAVVCTVVTAFLWFMNDLLLALRNFKACFIGSMLSVVCTLGCYRFFVDVFGMNGVSFCGIAAYAIGALSLMLFFSLNVRNLRIKRQNS